MSIAKQAQPAFLPTLWDWSAYQILRTIAAMKPEFSASEVATVIARSGNPAGA